MDTSDKQSHDYTSTNPNHYLGKDQPIQHHGMTTASITNNTYKRTSHNYTSTLQQQHNNRNSEDLMTISHTTSCTPTSSLTSAHVCPKDYSPVLPLRPCGESVPQLYTVTNKKIPVYGIKYVPYKQDNFRIMITYYVCDVKYPILSASRLLDKGYGLDFNPRHCTITHGQQQGFDIYPMTTDNGKSIAVIQPTEKATQQQEQNAALTHTDQGLRQILGENTDYWKLDGDYAIRVHKRPRRALFTPHNSGCPIPEGELDDWRLTIINRQGQEQEQLQKNPTQLSKQELQRRLEGDNWTGETRFRRKVTPTRRATSKTTPTRQSSQLMTNGHATNLIKDPTTSTAKDMETQSSTFYKS